MFTQHIREIALKSDFLPDCHIAAIMAVEDMVLSHYYLLVNNATFSVFFGTGLAFTTGHWLIEFSLQP